MRNVEQTPSWRGMFVNRHVADVDGSRDWHRRVVGEIATGVEAIAGRPAAQRIETDGVALLHEVIDAGDVARLREHVIERLREDLLRLAVRVGRHVLGWRSEFFVDDYLILRVNFPYEIARRTDPGAENPGIGRVSPDLRDTARARRVIDPIFDPRGYHKDHPPAAWAHGPHRDSWAGHSKDGVNIWWAISNVPPEAGMVFYHELDDVDFEADPRSGYLRAGFPLPKPSYAPLSEGEMLVFDPEVLHGTHLNITDKTRVALSMRLNAQRPRFDPTCFYAREFWHQATRIETGAFGDVLHLKREENLAAAHGPLPIPPAPRPLAHVVEVPQGASQVSIGASSRVREGERLVVTLGSHRVMVARVDGVLRGYDCACPHYGVDLADGAIDAGTAYCPGCGVGFDLRSGHCRTRALALGRVGVSEERDDILVEVPR